MKITIRTEYIVKMHGYIHARIYAWYPVHRNACRITLCPPFQSLKICTCAKLCRWKSQRNYCFGDYFVSLMRHVDRITLYLPCTGRVGNLSCNRYANKDRSRDYSRSHPSYYSGIWCSRGLVQVHAVECKCVSNVAVKGWYVQVNPICPQGSRYDIALTLLS